MNAVAPLKLPFIAVRGTARVGRKLARFLVVPALGATVGGMAHRALHRGERDGGESRAGAPTAGKQTASKQSASEWAAVPEQVAPASVTREPGLAVVDAIDPEKGVVLASELPIPSFDELPAKDAARLIKELEDVEDVRTVLRFEEENSKRPTVLTAAQAKLSALEN